MIVQIIGSARNLKENLPFYRNILDLAHDNGAEIAQDWISTAEKEKKSTTNWADVHKANVEAIDQADAVIIEATDYGFQEGFYTSLALQKRKPVLLLTREDISGLLVSGIHHNLLDAREYKNKDNLQKVVSKFLSDNIIPTKDLRFNFFIDRQIYSFLRETSYETGQNKSEIIRRLIEEEIDKQER